MKSNECVGGILGNGEFVRLLDSNGSNQPIDCDFEIGQIWEIEYQKRNNCTAPHVEDILITSKTFNQETATNSSIATWIESNFNDRIWRGSPDILFDGLIQWTDGGSGYINQENGIPSCSRVTSLNGVNPRIFIFGEIDTTRKKNSITKNLSKAQ